ncbi:MAG: hypothetical protein ACI9Z4_002421 [Polaribacter sp.]|jgi:hypothetical protein
MKKTRIIASIFLIIISSCVSKKEYTSLENSLMEKNKELATVVLDLDFSADGILLREQKNAALESKINNLKSEAAENAEILEQTVLSHKIENNGNALQVKDLQTSNAKLKKTSYSLNSRNMALKVSGDALIKKYDSLVQDNIPIEKKGYVTFVCPLEMKEGAREQVSAIIGRSVDYKKLNARILKIVNEERAESNKKLLTTDDVDSGVIDLSKRMKIELIGDSIDFDEMILIDGEPIKTINLKEGSTWEWFVRPKLGTSGRSLKLIFKIIMIDENGKELMNKAELFDVKINVQKSYFQELKAVVWKDPKWPITVLLIPFVTFFAGIWKEKRKQKS